MIANGASDKGVAPGALLYSSAASAQSGWALAFQHLSDGTQRPHIMNLSAGTGLPAGAVLDGNSLLTQFIDWSAQLHDALYVVAGNQGVGGSPIPTDEYNGLTVARTMKDSAGVFRQLSPRNNTLEDAAGLRRSVDLVAPGDGINVPMVGGGYELASGTSYAAPHVAATAALLHEYAKERDKPGGGSWSALNHRATRHEVIKAVLMNSADKLKDTGDGLLLGMEKTILKKDGTSTWLDSDARDSADNPDGKWNSLDEEMGVGQLNAKRALKQYAPGEQGVGLNKPAIGWDLEHLNANTPEGVHKYGFANKLKGGSYVSLTMAWDRRVILTDTNSNTQYDAGESFVSQPLAMLELFLLPKGSTSIRDAVASSISFDSVQHIFFKLPPGDAEYEFWAQYSGSSTPPVDYSIAWWAMEAPGAVRGRAWNDSNGDGIQNTGEAILANVAVNLTLADGSIRFSQTNALGNYEFLSVPLGSYYVSVTPPQTKMLTAASQGIDRTKDSDFDPTTNRAVGTLGGANPTATLDAGFVAMASTTTTLTANTSNSFAGQTITLTATVSPSTFGGTPTGTVTFMDGNVSLGSVALGTGTNGTQAVFSIATLSVGSHSLTAVYSGSATHTGSTSTALTVTVQIGTVTEMLASSNPSVLFGTAVTFTATIYPSSQGVAPTGTIAFYDGNTLLATIFLSHVGNSYQATFTISTLARGSHSISAVYSGDQNFLGATSSLTEFVS